MDVDVNIVDVNIAGPQNTHRRKRFLLRRPFYVHTALSRKGALRAGSITLAKRNGHSMVSLTWVS